LPIDSGGKPICSLAEHDIMPERVRNHHDAGDGSAARGGVTLRPYIGVLFECCGVYVRVYRRPDQMVYLARCPRCLRLARVRVGQDGTDARFFRAC
jgi:hypothetical protein